MYVRHRVRSVPARNIAATETKIDPGAGGREPAGSRKEADGKQQTEINNEKIQKGRGRT